LLEAVALNLGAVPIGAFHDEEVQAALGLPSDHEPLYLIPVGHPGDGGR
jgi:nitroreductase